MSRADKPSKRQGHAQSHPQRSHPQRSGALFLYLHEIEKIPVLSPDEERKVALQANKGDRRALEKLVRHNLRFVVSVARQYSGHGVPLEDLINEGNIGLIRAAKRFDPSRGFRLISYAIWWIRQGILAYLTDQSRLVRLPAGKVHSLTRLGRESERLAQEFGREPILEELAGRLDLSPRQVEILQSLPTFHFSLDEPAEGEDSDFEIDTLEDQSTPSIEAWLLETLRSQDIQAALHVLDAREADILTRYFGLSGDPPESLQSIGQDYRVTRERIRQLRDRALWKLRTSVHADLLREYAS